MVDVPGSTATTSLVTVGSTTDGTLETLGDHDWYRIDLTAGQSITIQVNGVTLEDPYLYVRNSSGTLLYENDDVQSGVIRNSQLAFTATYSGAYYIDVGAWNEGYTGSYQVVVSTYTPPPVFDYDQIAYQLTNGYWGGNDQPWNITQGGTITYNVTALTSGGQFLARQALALWSDIIGVTFQEVTTGGQITFDDNESGAFADSTQNAGGYTTSAHVNVETQWLTNYGTSLDSYAFQTYIHEIGHALGLGHAGNYNGSARYPYDALYQNDSWATTVMSYFDQQENTYFAGQGFTEEFLASPMVADIIAMSNLYGLSTTTRTGNTTYGYNSTANRDIFNASLFPDVSYTVFDSGGIDTLDYSGYAGTQRINLNSETFSNVLGNVGNVAIARGTVIENAIGGSGIDVIIGNAAANRLEGRNGNDTLDGGAGADTLIGGLGNDLYVVDNLGDVITELANQGSDTLVSRVTYALEPGASIETITTINSAATTAINLTGNDVSQSIYGNAGDNRLTGGGGADYLVGLSGNDWYFVDLFDFIAEDVGGGDDWIFVVDTYTLREGAEIETLIAADQNSLTPVNLTGNEFGQSLYGSIGANQLSGGAGNDYLVGLAGNDFLMGGPGNDNLNGGPGNDVYYLDAGDQIFEAAGEGEDIAVAFESFTLNAGAYVETLSAAEGTSAINLTGNELGQSIYGNAGANVLNGGGGDDYLNGGNGNDQLNGGIGNDWLVGGAGNDRFVFNGATPGNDTIADFAAGADKIDLTAYGITAAQVSATAVTGGTLLSVDSNHDGIADFTIMLSGAGIPAASDYLF